MYVIPYVEKYFENYDEYNVGDIVEYSNNGVDRWVVAEVREWNSSLVLIPETPIELVIESVDDNINEKANQIIQSFNNDVYDYGNYATGFIDNLPNLIPNFLNQQMQRIYIFNDHYIFKENNKIKIRYNIVYYENGFFMNSYEETLYTDTNPYTLGYRPVVTLKVKKEIQDKDKKEISSKLKVGDNVKYEAKGYKNWKVLGVDNDLGTVDIISGGIVKNLTLSGKEDWDNYEDIIHREINEYKNGPNAKKVTTVTSSHLKQLKEVDKNILSRYFILSKSSYVKSKDYNGRIDNIYYTVGTIYLYKIDNYEMYIDNIALYVDFISVEEQEVASQYKSRDYYANSINSSSFTAGLRPVITLKLDSVEKLSDKEVEKIKEETEKQERIYIKEQETKNKDYKGPSKVDDTTSSTGKNNTINSSTDSNNTSSIEKIVYKDRPFYKYGFFILLVICIIETILLLIPKINKK